MSFRAHGRSCLLAAAIIIVAGITAFAKSAESKQPLKARQLPQKPKVARVDAAATGHVVVKFAEDAKVRLRNKKLVSMKGKDISRAEGRLKNFGNRLERHFKNFQESRLDKDKATFSIASKTELADLNSYYRVEVNSGAQAEELINYLNGLSEVEVAYFQPLPEVATDIAPPTPSWKPNQDYREAAPAGVDADFANTQPGGDGTGVKIIDIEFAWQTTHEDLSKAVGQIITPVVGSDRNHGTAVIGEMIAGDDGYGVTGICPGADIGMVSVAALSTAEALYTAIDNLNPGDMILIELHAPGPHFNFQVRSDQLGYVAMEYWQDNFDAIQYAWAKGITVCEAAGNGAENYDDAAIYGQLFDTTFRNSHAIVIGAGYPAASANNLQRHSFSNYGERVNLQGYGSGVYTTGYGGLFNPGGDENQWYTSGFSGTSSASPIVTGAAACLQGYYMATHGTWLTSDQIRDALVPTGTPQLGDITKPIGPRPNLAAAMPTLDPPSAIYSEPFVLDAAVAEGSTTIVTLWLKNRSSSTSHAFSITDTDSAEFRLTADWLQASPDNGVVAPSDSVQITVTIDATVITGSLDRYLGSLDVSWGSPLDSLFRVPVYVTIPCADSTYLATSTNETTTTYGWIDARVLGTKINNASYYNSLAGSPLDDGSTGPHAVGFDFPFYDTSYTQMYIGVNGAISFTNTEVNVGGYFSGFEIPGAPWTTTLAAFYSDLIINTSTDPNAGIYLYRSATNDTVVIEWYRVANFNAPGTTATFEIILTADGSVKYQYQSVDASGLSPSVTIGISASGCEALGFFNGDDPAHQMNNLDAARFEVANPPVYILSGNCDNEGGIDISDLTYLIGFLFLEGPAPVIPQSGDLDCDSSTDISDLTLLIDYLFISLAEGCYYLQP